MWILYLGLESHLALFSQAPTDGWTPSVCLGKACLTSVSPQATERRHRCWSLRLGYWLSHERFGHDLVEASSNPNGLAYDPLFFNFHFCIKTTTLNTNEWITRRSPHVNPWSKVLHLRVTGGFQPCEKTENLCVAAVWISVCITHNSVL